jgi:hypothetical protein
MAGITDLTCEQRLVLIETEVDDLGLGDDNEVIVKYLIRKAYGLGYEEGHGEGYDEGRKEGYAEGECADPLGWDKPEKPSHDRREILPDRFQGEE